MKKIRTSLLLALSLHVQFFSPAFAASQDEVFASRSQKVDQFLFHELPRDLGGDLRESFWGWGSLAFGLGIGATAALYPFDDDIQKRSGHHQLFGKTSDDVLGLALSPYVLGGGGFVTWVVGAAAKQPKVAVTGLAISEAMALSMAFTAVTKFSFRRERPNGHNFSFSSGHSAGAFSTATVLASFYGWKAAIPAYGLATLVSVSRLSADDHFASDLLMGAVIGGVVGWGTAKFHKGKHPDLFVTPQITREQASVSLTYKF